MTSDTAFDDLVRQIRSCRICVDQPIGKPLPHEPRPVLVPSQTARILIAGQAPGTRVHDSGIPFTDSSGDRLRTWLGVTAVQFYNPDLFAIVPMGFCFPGFDAHGGDLPPRKECAPAWRSSLLALMPQIDLVIAVGGYAHAWHLKSARHSSVTGAVFEWRSNLEQSPNVFALPHPSWRNSGWLKRNPWFETELLPVLRSEVSTRLY